MAPAVRQLPAGPLGAGARRGAGPAAAAARTGATGPDPGFEFSHELAWNLLKDYLQHQGIAGIIGSRDATRLAFQNDLISDGEGALRDRFIAAIRQVLASHREVEAAILYGSRALRRLRDQNSIAAAVADLAKPEDIGQRRPQRSSPSLQSPRISRPAPPQTRRSGRSLRPPPTSRSGSKPSRWK